MRKVIYSMSVSLDGYIETVDKKIDWVIVDEEFHPFANQQARGMSAFLYGRCMYELMATGWPPVLKDPTVPEYMLEFARIWLDKPKMVFSRTLDKVEWNSILVKEDIAGVVKKLKAQPGGDMGLGGAGIAASFIQLGLVDEFRLFIQPVVLGNGTPFFPPLEEPLRLELLESRTFGSGVVYLRYQRTTGET